MFGLAPWFWMNFKEGTYAEYVSAKEDWLAHAPKSLPLHEAGQVPLVALTAWQVSGYLPCDMIPAPVILSSQIPFFPCPLWLASHIREPDMMAKHIYTSLMVLLHFPCPREPGMMAKHMHKSLSLSPLVLLLTSLF